ncbi:ATP-binding cassette domain-containing protein [Erwinia sp. CPCC 100877]|nr:ATP-binding cassette domain-containing protein [Erwinia sp. CPCC 100877]
MLKVTQAEIAYKKRTILKDISFELFAGQSVCLLGKNGVGKSTLFKSLLGFLPLRSGAIYLNERLISDYSKQELAQQIAYIPQKQKGVFHFTVFEMILMGTTARLKSYQQPGSAEYQLAEAALDLLNIRYLKEELFSEISGGEQQLVIIARSVAQQSKIIIMDEPCANLDYGNQIIVLEMIKKLTQEGFLIIQATHDPNHALQYGDYVLILQEGKLTLSGVPSAILTSEVLAEMYQVPIEVGVLAASRQLVCVPKNKVMKN